jgi:ribosome-binding factor A
MSHKPEQLAHEIQKAVQDILARGLSDPRISGLITITKTRVQADLKRAELFVSILPADRQNLTMHGLHSAEKHIRRQVGDLVRTRSIPELVFVLDSTLKKEAAVLEDLKKIKDEQGARELAAPQSPAGFGAPPTARTHDTSKDHA